MLVEFAMVFQLKLIWNLFTNAGSLWVAWVNGNILRKKSFWTLQDSLRLSRTIKGMISLRQQIAEFIQCEMRNSLNISFSYDTWTTHGPLINFIGSNGPRSLRMRKEALVVEVVRNGEWRMPGARSETQQQLMITLTTIAPPQNLNGPDVFLWRRNSGSFENTFSSKDTWEQLRVHSPLVPWNKVVWLKEGVPRYSFILWLAIKGRLPTRDRLRTWGLSIPTNCVLCSDGIETHDHLFFKCSFSARVWQSFASRIWRNPPSADAVVIAKLLLQSACYMIWLERNARLPPSPQQVPQYKQL
ncbi:PREDICTED: uncharacterized protein LOC104744616 [Camelina sativa]|uniref:Uncharacterized protein LOC104744616 n=1 Tax=Camelina sativa TaxID=90675 RepID=A0ABM1R0Y1_CAMSA|nr:PREDICTED: uncharacterized protein LOC104744616 [Camelina sativa]